MFGKNWPQKALVPSIFRAERTSWARSFVHFLHQKQKRSIAVMIMLATKFIVRLSNTNAGFGEAAWPPPQAPLPAGSQPGTAPPGHRDVTRVISRGQHPASALSLTGHGAGRSCAQPTRTTDSLHTYLHQCSYVMLQQGKNVFMCLRLRWRLRCLLLARHRYCMTCCIIRHVQC